MSVDMFQTYKSTVSVHVLQTHLSTVSVRVLQCRLFLQCGDGAVYNVSPKCYNARLVLLQVPFPNPFLSVETLLSVCLSSDSQLLSGVDKHNYVKSLQSWAMHFAVTSQQRTNTDTLFEKAEKDVGL